MGSLRIGKQKELDYTHAVYKILPLNEMEI